jgi:hypothetical protein
MFTVCCLLSAVCCLLSAVTGPVTCTQLKFLPNEFPYQAPAGTHHWVQWYCIHDPAELERLTDDVVSGDISAALWGVVGSDEFEFVWYQNPKPSCSHEDRRLFHVQVRLGNYCIV